MYLIASKDFNHSGSAGFAEFAATRGLALHPYSAEIRAQLHLQSAIAHNKLGHPDCALKSATTGIEEYSQNPQINACLYMQRALAYLQLKQTGKSLEATKRANQLLGFADKTTATAFQDILHRFDARLKKTILPPEQAGDKKRAWSFHDFRPKPY
jgi:hypothetical protein